MFFEPPAPRPEEPPPDRRSQPPWMGRPRGVLLGGVPLEVVLVREPKLAVALSRLGACADGFEGELTVLATDDLGDEVNSGIFGSPSPWRRRGERPDPALELRFGVQYADGSKCELHGWARAPGEPGRARDEPPSGPIICMNGGQGGEGEWRQRLWFWPLPPPGAMTFALEWRAQGVELQLRELDAAPIREAAERSLTLIAAGAMPHTPSYTTHAMRADDGGEREP